MSSFYEKEELKSLGLKSVGENVLISRKCSIYGAENISIGNNVRIDDFCILSGKIEIGNYVHIAAYASLFGGSEGIYMKDFSGLSSRGTIYAASDDYSGDYMTNPTVPSEYTHVISKRVILEKHVLVGASSVILPGVTLEEGAACGTFTLVNRDLEKWTINVGIPAKKIKERSKEILVLEKKLRNEWQGVRL